MNRLKIIINLILGKSIVIYNNWNKEVLMIIGSNEEIITKRYDYDFLGNNDYKLIEKNGKICFLKEE